ncbi:retrovirus-related Pol polyprotein from transposon 297 [Trichonephila clavipes]|nr:retrovirus-related Pol polyprotein from transposon 297 [Trichonephila clavipes]
MEIQLEMQKLSQAPVVSQQLENPKLELNRIIPRFSLKEDEMCLYLTIFERQAKFLNIPEKTWTAYLIGSLLPDIAQLILRENEDQAQNYEKKKTRDSTWQDFYFELSSYFECWIKELKITTFDQLKCLTIADQIKKKNSSKYQRTLSGYLSGKVNLLEDPVITTHLDPLELYLDSQVTKLKEETPYSVTDVELLESSSQSVLPARELHVTLFNLNSGLYSSSEIVLKIFGEKIAVCADTGASCTIAGEKMFKFLQEHDVIFTNKRISFMMADGIRQTIMALSTVIDLYIEGKVIPTEFLELPEAKGKRTLLGLDFLIAAGIILDVQGGKWHFSRNLREQYKFFKKTFENVTPSAFELREHEGKNLSPEQTRKLNILLKKKKGCFQPGEEPTPFTEHRIDTGDHPPIATSPYRMNPIK